MRRRGRTRWVVAVVVLAMVLAAYGVAAVVINLSRSVGAPSPAVPAGGPPTIPPTARSAYVQAAAAVPASCTGLTWQLLAGIGAVESRHGLGRDIDGDGTVTPRILGPRLDGSGVGGNVTPRYDTDGGALDGDTTYDRAVGPMQFMPATWAQWGRDGNADGTADPQNLYDAARSAAAYLCGTGPADLADPDQRRDAILRYNASSDYAARVEGYAAAYG